MPERAELTCADCFQYRRPEDEGVNFTCPNCTTLWCLSDGEWRRLIIPLGPDGP